MSDNYDQTIMVEEISSDMVLLSNVLLIDAAKKWCQ